MTIPARDAQVARGENRCSQLLQPVHETGRQRQVMGQNPLDPEVEDVFERGPERDAGAVTHR